MVRFLTPISGKKKKQKNKTTKKTQTPPKYENQTIPAQCNSIDKILSERSANEIIVGCGSSLFRKEKAVCAFTEDTELTFLCPCVGGNDAGGGTWGWERIWDRAGV